MATVFIKEVKPGSPGDATLTWDDMTETWNAVKGTWNTPRELSATSFTDETKPTTSFTDETKP